MTITYRLAKGSALTHAELDGNFTDLAGKTATLNAASYGLSIPFDGSKVMPPQSVTSATAFTPNVTGALPGGSCYVRLTSDGINVPTFSGFKQDASSHGWGVPSGTINRIFFWFDGTDYYYSVQQEAGLAIVVPVLAGAAIPLGVPNTIVLTYSVPLNTSAPPATSAYTPTNTGGSYTVSSVAVSGSTVTLTMSRAAISADVVTLGYTVPGTNPVQSLTGGLAIALSSQAVVNNVGVADSLTFQTIAGMTESSAGGYKSYTTTVTDAWTTAIAGNPTKSLPASPASDVYFQASVSAISGMGVGLHTDATTSVNAFSCANFVFADTTAYNMNAGGFTVGSAITPLAGDVIRYRRTSANVLYIEISQDAGATWVVRGSKTGVTGTLYPRLNGSPSVGLVYGTIKCNGS